MPSKAVADACDARLVANWTATPIIPYDTVAQPPDNADAFVVLQYPVSNGARPVLGRTFFEEGVIRIVLNVRRGIGLPQGLQWAGDLALIFRVVTFDGVVTDLEDGPVIDDTIENGNWVEYSIIVPYRYQFKSAAFEPASI
jgi:Bacteriophage related domain of unknown function